MYFQLLLQSLVEVWNERLKLTSLPLILLQQQVWIILERYGMLHVCVMVAGYILYHRHYLKFSIDVYVLQV